ncbi:hypothetical protein GCM10020000_80690 [Streptomyces olivoverticillatus]
MSAPGRTAGEDPPDRRWCSDQEGSPGRWSGLCLVSPPPEQVVRNAARAGHDLEMEPVEQLIGGLPEPNPRTEFHLRDRHMHGVDKVGIKELPDGGDPAAESDVLALRRFPRPFENRDRVAVDKVECGVGERDRRTFFW